MAFDNVMKQVRHSALQLNGDRTVFYLPGVFGDEPKQAMLREHLADRIKFTTVTLPDVETPVSTLCDLTETGRIVADEISRLQQQGEIFIVGFSFGASLALEVASQLTHRGRTVAYLGLIDGPLNIDDMRYTLRGLLRLLTAPRVVFILSKFIREKLAKYLHLSDLNSNAISDKGNASDYRFTALKNWNAKACEADGIIILSIFFYERSSLNWKSQCPNCKQVRILSDHHNVIAGSALRRVASLIAESIAGISEKPV